MLSNKRKREPAILSIDVEDNFTRDELKKDRDWDKYEDQVVMNTERAVRLVKDLQADATFFVVGQVAERHPEAVKIIDSAGYEIGSHSYYHKPVWKMTKDEFEFDLKKSISTLENITQKRVNAYRAMAFSIRSDTLWAMDVLKQNGIYLDSSLTDVTFSQIIKNENKPFILNNHLHEFPIPTINILGRRITLTGGLVLRSLPYHILRLLLNRLSSSRTKIIYCHVWEFNKDQPERRVNILQSLSQNPVTYTTEKKLRCLSRDYRLLSISNYLKLKFI